MLINQMKMERSNHKNRKKDDTFEQREYTKIYEASNVCCELVDEGVYRILRV